MIIYHNISALYANRQLFDTGLGLDKNIEKLSSGMRINKAGDDASGLAVSEKMRSQVRGLNRARQNAQDGISFVQVAEGATQEIHSILHRQRELAIQAANGIYTPEDRAMIQVEVSQLTQEIDRIATQTQFNKMLVLNGNASNVNIHVGANPDQSYSISVRSMTASSLGVQNASISTPEMANSLLTRVDNAVNMVSKQRADLGAYQSRLESTMRNLSVASENTQAAESRIRDTDMASEMVNFVRNQILTRTGAAMLAQANLKSQAVLALLG